MVKSENSKRKDSINKSNKYKNMTKEQRKEFQRTISRNRTLRRQHVKAAKLTAKRQIKEATTAAKIAIKEAKREKTKALLEEAKATKTAIKLLANKLLTRKQKNISRCRKWRLGKQATPAIIKEANLRRSQRTKTSINYNEIILVEEVFIPGLGNGVRALVDISPANFICEYGGIRFTSKAVLRRKLAEGNDKILKVTDKQIWWDGQTSATLGPKLNHACSCVSNCEITWNGDIPLICSKASLQGTIKKGDYLTLDYGYDIDDGKFEDDPHMDWYVQYLRCHVCKIDK